MTSERARPLSPHLTIWKWGPAMAASIFHRVTGNGLATVGAMGLVWWLFAAASGPEAYASFLACATSWFGKLVGIGLTWFFFQHLFGGIRHLILDMGAGFELKTNKSWSLMVFAGAIITTALVWLCIFWKAL